MTNQPPPYGDGERTAPVPPYGHEPTAAFPFDFGSPAERAPYPQPQPQPQPQRRGGSRTAGLLAAALVAGGLAGVGGAAAYDALDTDRSTTPASSATTDGASSGDDRPTGSTDSAAPEGSADSPAPEASAEQVAATVLPSVVKINVAGAAGQGSGSGIILSADGEILTNNHVVEALQGGGRMTVDFTEGMTAEATVVGTDPVTDLAVIKAQDVSGLTPAQIGDSEALDVGEAVVAIGSPFGLEATVTSGIVSSLNRPVSIGATNPDDDTTYPAIQTDAAINPGNSGGPLVNLAGQVVGINSSIRTSTSATGEGGSIGLGFAIPITKVLPIVDQLRNGETPTHALLGVNVTTRAEDNGLVTGAGIAEVTEGSAGAEAGLRPGDVVTRVDDQEITSSGALVATIRGYRPGDTVTLRVLRDGETLELRATLDSDQE